MQRDSHATALPLQRRPASASVGCSASCGHTVSSPTGSGSSNCRRTATSSAKPLPADVPRGRPIDFSATTLQLDVHVGDVSVAGLDAYSLGSAVGRERDPGAKRGGAQFAFEAACGDTSSHVTGYVSRSLRKWMVALKPRPNETVRATTPENWSP